MLDGNQIYSVIPLIVGVLMLSLGLYVFGLNRDVKVSNAFIAAMCFGSLASVSEFLMMIVAGDAAVILARFAVFFSVAMFGGFLYVALTVPYESEGRWIVDKKVAYSILVAVSGLVPALLIQDVSGFLDGWQVASSSKSNLGVWIWVSVLIFYAVVAIFYLIQLSLANKSSIVRKQCTLMSVAIAFPLIYNFMAEGLFPGIGLAFPPLLSSGFLATAVILGFVVLKTKMFVLEPVMDEAQLEERKRVASLLTGTCRLLEGKKPDAAYDAFIKEVTGGSQGLLVSRVHPDQVRERYGMAEIPIFWLTSQPGQQRIDPASLSILQHTISNFMQKGHAVVLLDGLEYLISNNGADKVIRVIYSLKDTAVTSGSKLIIPLDPNILDTKELALFERELSVEKMELSSAEA